MPALTHTLERRTKRLARRPGRWLRRTRWVLGRTRADLGLGGPRPPLWARDNPFLAKAGLSELRRFRLGWRLAWTVGLLGAILVGAAALARAYPRGAEDAAAIFGVSLPFATLCLLAFVHATLIAGARQAAQVSLADEVRRGTLPHLLLLPLSRAEMLLAMGIGPARSAGLALLAGLPIYVLLAQVGALSGRDVFFLFLLLSLTCYAPPVYAVPARGGEGSPEAEQGRAAGAPVARAARGGRGGAAAWPFAFSLLTISPLLGLMGGWLGHLLTALGVSLPPGLGRMTVALAWPVYGAQILGGTLPLFHARVSPLPFVLLLLALSWAASALETASALAAGDPAEMNRLPLMTRARTLARVGARLSALLALGVVWTAWVESGDTALLAGGAANAGGWDAAGLLLGLGVLCLPTVCARALASPKLSARRALARGLRPLGAAGLLFLVACGLGGLSPLARPVGVVALELLGAGAATALWGWGLKRRVPALDKTAGGLVLYGFPVAMLYLPAPLPTLAVLSPVALWVRLLPTLAARVTQLPQSPAALPPLWECLAGTAAVGLILGLSARRAKSARTVRASPTLPPGLELPALPPAAPPARPAPPTVERNQALSARLLAWVTARTDNPLFTHELRARTRSGRWADWRFFAPAGFGAAVALGLTYPDVINALSFLSPFHFFALTRGPFGGLGGTPWANLAALTLAAECYFLAFRAPARGEALIARDRQRGIWGFLLLTPLSAAQIFRGKLWGQSAGPLAALAVGALAALGFSLLCVPDAGAGPALASWALGQAFALSLWLFGVSVGAALSSWPVFSGSLRGAAPLLFTILAGLGVWADARLVPWDAPGDWTLLAGRFGRGIGGLLSLSLLLLWLAERRIAALRRRDVAFGDGAG